MAPAKSFDWNDLRYFLAAARTLSLAGAARMLGVEHSTVGRRLTSLETALGARLMLRKPDGLALTTLGEQVLLAAHQVELAANTVADVAASAQERVRLAVPSGFSLFFTAPLDRLRASKPPIALDIVSGARKVDLAQGEADLAVRGGPVDDADLVACPLCSVGWSLYASPVYLAKRPANATATDLDGHDVIGFAQQLADTPNARWLDSRCGRARVVLRGSEVVDIAAAAAEGAGVALLPCYLGDRAASLVRLTPEVLVKRELVLVYRREMRLSEAVKLVIDVTRETFEEAREKLAGHASPVFASLTQRQRELLELLAQGRDNAQIAATLSLSDKTVRNHVSRILTQLEVENRSQAIVKARDAGFGFRGG